MLKLTDRPVVMINQESIFTFINTAFTEEFGWKQEDLLGKPVTAIMPAYMRDAHTVGISRFLTTGAPQLLGKPLPLSVLYEDGTVTSAEHYILGDKLADGTWRFAAIISPPEDDGPDRA